VQVPHREIERLAKAMVMERRDEFLAKAKASSVVQNEIQRLRANGRERAKARGVKFGRKLKLTPHQRHEASARKAAGEALAAIGRGYNVSHSTISRLG
jgi:DNA invertase Pin-like site-specific DNA recombinase